MTITWPDMTPATTPGYRKMPNSKPVPFPSEWGWYHTKGHPDTRIEGCVSLETDARVEDHAQVYGYARLGKGAIVRGAGVVRDYAFCRNGIVEGCAVLGGHGELFGCTYGELEHFLKGMDEKEAHLVDPENPWFKEGWKVFSERHTVERITPVIDKGVLIDGTAVAFRIDGVEFYNNGPTEVSWVHDGTRMAAVRPHHRYHNDPPNIFKLVVNGRPFSTLNINDLKLLGEDGVTETFSDDHRILFHAMLPLGRWCW